PLVLIALRGERAGVNRLAESIERGLIAPPDLAPLFEAPSNGDPSLLDGLLGMQRGRYQDILTDCLRIQTHAIEIARLPWAQQSQAWAVWKKQHNQMPQPGHALLGAFEKTVQAGQRSQALLHCAITILAVERFRLQEGRWPEVLDELCPHYLE